MGILNNGLAWELVQMVFASKVTPVPGSVVYCQIIGGLADHSGIYVGNNRIVHLNGSGDIEAVSPDEFLNRMDGFNTALNIYVSSKDGKAVGSNLVAKRALDNLDNCTDYSLIMNNCHRFVGGCLTGDFHTYRNFLWAVTTQAELTLGATAWDKWDR